MNCLTASTSPAFMATKISLYSKVAGKILKGCFLHKGYLTCDNWFGSKLYVSTKLARSAGLFIILLISWVAACKESKHSLHINSLQQAVAAILFGFAVEIFCASSWHIGH